MDNPLRQYPQFLEKAKEPQNPAKSEKPYGAERRQHPDEAVRALFWEGRDYGKGDVSGTNQDKIENVPPVVEILALKSRHPKQHLDGEDEEESILYNIPFKVLVVWVPIIGFKPDSERVD